MRSRLLLSLPALVLLSACAHHPPPVAAAPQPRLFALFEKYCVATGGQYAAMEAALTADGYRDLTAQSVLKPIFAIQSTSWQKGQDVVSYGPQIVVKTGPDGKKDIVPLEPKGSKGEWCKVIIQAERDDSQSRIAQWAAVPPLQQFDDPKSWGDELNDKYAFTLRNGRHVAVAYQDRLQAVAAGGNWYILFYKRGKEYGISLSHHYMPQEAKK